MLRTLIALLGLALAVPVAAQSLSTTTGGAVCGTPSPSFEDRIESAAAVTRWRSAPPATLRLGASVVTIPVAFHVVSGGDSPIEGNVPDEWIDAQIDVLNAAFEPLGYQFVLVYTGRVQNDRWFYDLAIGSTEETQMKQTLALDPSRFLNIYTARLVSYLLGWASFPDSRAETNLYQGVVLDAQTLPGGAQRNYGLGDTATHEVGHWMGLYHTFESKCGELNCSTQGDQVCDTPTQARSTLGCPADGLDTCPDDPGPDPIHNFMDYSYDVCMDRFTGGQTERVQALMAQFRPTIVASALAFASPDVFSVGDLFVGQQTTATVRVVNLSGADLLVTSITSDTPDLRPGVASLTVPARSTADLDVTYRPTSEAQLNASLRLTTTNPDVGTLTVRVTGTSQFQPALAVERQALSAVLQPGETAVRPLVLSNTGAGRLSYVVPGASGAPARTGGQPAAPDAGLPPGPGQKGVADPRVGSAVTAAFGGPDAAGYRWVDSASPGGPAYRWVDILETGTALPLADDQAVTVPLPFSFPFYGAAYTSVRIVSNGYLTFDTSNLASTNFGAANDPIPNPSRPNAVIAPYWDDLDPGRSGRLRYQTLSDGRFVVSWLGVPKYNDDTPTQNPGSYTFQVILSPDGGIVFQYNDIRLGDTPPSATTGVENGTGTVGLQVAYSTPYPRNSLAVRIAQGVTGVANVTPPSGLVGPGQTETLSVTLSAAGLAAGVHQDLLTIVTNDPLVPELKLHTVVAVGDVLAPPALASPRYALDGVPTDASLDWLPVPGAVGYDVEVSPDEAFTTPTPLDRVTETSVAAAVSPNTTVYWRVRSASPTGTSVWSLPFVFTSGAAIVAEEGGAVEDRSRFGVDAPFPNPSAGRVSVPFRTSTPGRVTLSVLDVTGRTVAVLVDGEALPAGAHLRSWVPAGLSAGVYVVRLATEGGARASARFALVR